MHIEKRPSLTIVCLAVCLAAACAARTPAPRNAQPLAAVSPASAGLELVESAPIETPLGTPDLRDAYEVWPELIARARRSIDLAEFYASNAPGSRLEPIVVALEQAVRRGVRVRFLADAGFAKTYPETLERLERAGAELRRLDGRALGGGVLHAKYFLVDGEEVYLGSQNFDWRSLAHIQELGVRVRHPAVALALAAIFEADWMLAGGTAPAGAPAEIKAGPALVGEIAVTPVASPSGRLPDPALWDLPRLVALLDGARRTVRVQLLTYRVTGRDGERFEELDQALRRAAARGVRVQLLVSDWAKRKGSLEALQSLVRVPGIEVRFLVVPPWSGGVVPYARVAHAKYLVVDGEHAWVGTSNWERDYFFRSRNVGVILDSARLGARLDRFFLEGWSSALAEPVDPDRAYTPPRVGE
jgi:phosphatidylserine/phosphatidylglycerophosphate/cardiolipin synthase-like enzyme